MVFPQRFRRYLTFALVAAGTLAAGAASGQAVSPASAEGRLLTATNAARADHGIAALVWNDALAQAAEEHAALVVQSKQLSHQYAGEPDLATRSAQAGAHFQTVAENIAMGSSPDSIQAQWMKSPPHRANILDPNLTAVGFAVLNRGGYLYAVADFERAVSALTLEEQESTVARLLLTRGIVKMMPPLDARQTCEMSHGTAGGSEPLFVMRWQSSELSALPSALEERLRTGQYRSAAVGACSAANSEQGFTSYRIAVLLY